MKPRIMKYMYEAFIRPLIEYGAIIWYEKAKCIRQGNIMSNTYLQKIQRLALIYITSCSIACPTAAPYANTLVFIRRAYFRKL